MSTAPAPAPSVAIAVGGTTVLRAVPLATIEPGTAGEGVFVRFDAAKHAARHVFALGHVEGLRRFAACYRNEPWWMRPAAGTREDQVPVETQSLLVELQGGRFALIAPLIDLGFHGALQGGADGLALVVESDDPACQARSFRGLFIAVGDDPYALMRAGAEAVARRLATVRTRADKAVPGFIDRFGWCTWDAFYQDVSLAKVREGLESFRAGGVEPRFLILDDGWQSVDASATGEHRLTNLQANEKFPGDLAPTVRMAKGEYRIADFIVWHAFQGYWGGVDPAALPYRVVEQTRAFSPGVLTHQPKADTMFGPVHGLVAPEDIHRFFHDYHRHLRLQGVDGVKVDGQSSLEALSRGLDGRANLMRRWHEALEGSVQVHLRGNLINCMSCSTDVLYNLQASTIVRTSVDFWPKQPETHGLHLWSNAQVGMWFGEFCQPDWDMFQSGHPAGAFHAAGRAVSGGPVYVSDKPGAHDFALLRKLVLSDGTVLRGRVPGRPTRDCLFADPTRDEAALKIFTLNHDAGVVGVFNARYHEKPEERRAIAAGVHPADVEGLAADEYAVWLHRAKTLRRAKRGERVEITLEEMDYEVATIAPIRDGFAPIGLADKFNSSGAVTAKGADGHGGYRFALRDGGEVVVWAAKKPAKVLVDGAEHRFAYDEKHHALTLHVAAGAARVVTIA